MPRRVLIVSDFACATGFGRVMENLLARLDLTNWTPYIIALNYHGDPVPLRERYPHIFPASVGGGDAYGVSRIAAICTQVQPTLLVIQSDAWLVPLYLERLQLAGVTQPPTLAYCPPDSKNQPGGRLLTKFGVKTLVTPTDFGRKELILGGYEGKAEVLPYGVDTELYKPLDQVECRKTLYFPEEIFHDFVVGRADRNAQRKRYDLTIEGFAKWWVGAGQPLDAWFYAHCAMKDIGYDLIQLCSYWGRELGVGDAIERRLLYKPGLRPGVGLPERSMPAVYNTWNLHLSTAMGEGGGLVALESAACGVGQALVEYAAYGEWWGEDAAWMMPVRHSITTAGGGVNTQGGCTGVDDVRLALNEAYASWKGRGHTNLVTRSKQALTVARSNKHNWDTLAARFFELWEETI